MHTHSFVIEAGLLVRRSLINNVTAAAWERGLEISHERAGSTIRFTVRGDKGAIGALLAAIRRALA